MMLTEETIVPDAALPVEGLKRHLRMGSGFAEDDVQDAVLTGFLRAAIAVIEGRTSKTLLSRDFLLGVTRWAAPDAQGLGTAPVQSINSVTLIDRHGTTSVVAPTAYRLERDSQVPCLRANASALPSIPAGGVAELRFTAGYVADFGDLPGDLAQAVLLLAAHYYEYRDATSLAEGCMPFGVTSLLARYRPVRMGFGA
ncbi:head-tail connector protein [Roseivivax sp. CAU 1753]